MNITFIDDTTEEVLAVWNSEAWMVEGDGIQLGPGLDSLVTVKRRLGISENETHVYVSRYDGGN